MFLVLLTITVDVTLARTAGPPKPPFLPVRFPSFQPLPIDSNHTLGEGPLYPSFTPGYIYMYNVSINATSNVYSFNHDLTNGASAGIADSEASGFAATVSAVLEINVLEDSWEDGMVTFLAQLTVPDCEIFQGSPINQQGREVVKSTFGSDQPCLPSPSDRPR